MTQTHGLDGEEVKKFHSICHENFQSGYETYEVVTGPTYQHTLILSIALVNAQMEGNLALHASLTSIAARHCLALGYHREERIVHLPPIEAQRARRLFWTIFMFDKNLSLRLGRAPIIQDYNVDVKQCVSSQDTSDLELLKNVLDTIEQLSPTRDTLKRQFDLCTALYRIAEIFINDGTPTGQRTTLLDNTIPLPLQPGFLESWDYLDPNLPLPNYSASSAVFYI
ncbi:hypothetical protein CEP54_015874 [Fusarium duplospermum]|uniref:Xylanolytic transcriptional activator regulatory domain-containing protein n=1 Tax=Fusarium duplospermum TaxID=1325734 RepID=A0A428NKQ8_9HYPO|nr:hypothetical protein CEP54_015874 [Fusarium duplospermum]